MDSTSNNVAITCSNGYIYEWSLCSPRIKLLKNLKEDSHVDEIGTCIEYSPDGKYLILGTNQGNIYSKKKENPNFNLAPLLVSHKKKGI